jgi:hypothetical protein
MVARKDRVFGIFPAILIFTAREKTLFANSGYAKEALPPFRTDASLA